MGYKSLRAVTISTYISGALVNATDLTLLLESFAEKKNDSGARGFT